VWSNINNDSLDTNGKEKKSKREGNKSIPKNEVRWPRAAGLFTLCRWRRKDVYDSAHWVNVPSCPASALAHRPVVGAPCAVGYRRRPDPVFGTFLRLWQLQARGLQGLMSVRFASLILLTR
jgi:hypothetical protein